MTRLMVVLSALLLLSSCYRYNTHKGRVGDPQSPSPLPRAYEPDIPAVQYGSIPQNTIPDLLAPITRTVWIKGHQRPNGDYVGDYPLTCVFQKGQFVTHPTPSGLVPHAIGPPTQTKGKTSAGANPVPHATAPQGPLPGPVLGSEQQGFHITDYIRELQEQTKKAGEVVK